MVVCVFVALLPDNTAAADRSVPIRGSSIFYTTGNSSAVWSHKEEYGEDENPEYFSMFVLWDNDSAIAYRKHLAYHWVENDADESWDKAASDSDDVESASLTPKEGWFNMEIGFESYTFKKFIITFESQQYTQTKDGKTTNYVLFYPHEDDEGSLSGVQVVISGNIDDAPDVDDEVLSGHITIEFTDTIQGGYKVKVSDKDGNSATGEFENIGYTYARYSSSTTTPVTPLSFKSEFEERDENEEPGDDETYDNDYTRMVLYSLNGQSFRLGTYKKVERDDDGNLKIADGKTFEEVRKNYYVREGRKYVRNTDLVAQPDRDYYTYNTSAIKEDGGHYVDGSVNDDAPPVICFSNGVTHIGVGKELPFDYQLIDVLASSPSADTYYYMLTKTQAENKDFKPDNCADKKLFRLVTDSDNQYMEPHKDHYIPTSDDISVYDEDNFKVVAAVKVYLKLYDTRTENISQTTYVLLDWFIPQDKLVNVNDNYYIAVANDEIGVSFAYTDNSAETSTPDSAEWNRLVKSYQALVDKAAEGIKAGSKNYFYLPSFENIPAYDDNKENLGSLFADNITAYADLNFNVYYNNGSNGNTTTQKSNALSINLTKAGRYMFTIYASDKSSNPMYYYKVEGDKSEKKTFTASNIWSMRDSKKNTEYENTKDYLPWFYFTVEAAEIEIEDPGEREAAYVGTKYSSISFDVNAVSYKREYELYRFDNDVYYKAKGVALKYDEFMKLKGEFLDENGANYHPEWFTEIPAASTLTKGTDEYDEFYKYGWNSSSPEFVPQDENTFYVVKLTVTSTVDNLEPKTAYMGISASAKINSLKGEDTWLQDNMTSIILLSIAGASLIGIVLLIVIKPKNKGDIDEQFEDIKSNKTQKSKKKSK